MFWGVELGITLLILCWQRTCWGTRFTTQYRPQWAEYSKCLIRVPMDAQVPIFTMCDPDALMKVDSHEIGIHRDHIKTCWNQLQTKEINYTTVRMVLIYTQNITWTDSDSKTENSDSKERALDTFVKSAVDWFDLAMIPSFLVVVRREDFKIKEWFSDPLRKLTSSLPEEEDGRDLLYGADKDIQTSVSISYMTMCDVVEKMFYSVSFGLSSKLWIILAFIMGAGIISFVVWLYKFNKSHPTDETESYEMSLGALDDDGTVRYSNCPASDYILTKTEIEAASPDPAKSETLESVVHL